MTNTDVGSHVKCLWLTARHYVVHYTKFLCILYPVQDNGKRNQPSVPALRGRSNKISKWRIIGLPLQNDFLVNIKIFSHFKSFKYDVYSPKLLRDEKSECTQWLDCLQGTQMTCFRYFIAFPARVTKDHLIFKEFDGRRNVFYFLSFLQLIYIWENISKDKNINLTLMYINMYTNI